MKGEVKERGMIFNDEMVRAILGGNKTQTRRIVEEKFYGRAVAAELLAKHCPYGQPGDRIWVRETYRVHGKATDVATLVYRASVRNSWTEQTHRVPVEVCNKPVSEKWTPSIHMPRWASRILLEITNVRVERLNDISECDARAEGAPTESTLIGDKHYPSFRSLWKSIYGEDSWNANPWVWVIQADVAQAIEKLKRKLVECNRYNYCADAVKGVEYACHAAMLQGSQPVSQSKTYRLDFGQWLEQQRGKIDVDCGCVSTETFMHWLRVAYEAGNYPDIPDSSVPAPGKGVTGERIRIKPHVYRELVNRLHDTAIKCAGTQQLRERISRVLGDVITPYHHKQAEKSGLERCHLEAALNIKPGHTLGIIDALLVHKMARALLSLVDAGDTSEGEV
ncbi:TPA: hypothetical protein ACF2ZR_004734 [Escherichia coli]|uniref:Uncharacterized protein n=1 Tax=Escherichia coli TaxID=562 RepID=A0ACD5GJE5_ECOLX|nr:MULTISPECIES: hypothetical protein [Enterobacteriaceae]MCL8876114.1 hypothetical protein [Salmonella enterica subsp. enterica serovar Enteritidis]MCR2336530.1 hypothetical protein [Salmonella enterica]MCY4816721.1 hypothetical protein [Salmonella enterica subsp. enterica serovar 1,4,[5],12:i:-]MCC4683264.1 hypothetical protein [Escherichia coli]MCE3774317.1 hypothetical protein [Escherichia coli]